MCLVHYVCRGETRVCLVYEAHYLVKGEWGVSSLSAAKLLSSTCGAYISLDKIGGGVEFARMAQLV